MKGKNKGKKLIVSSAFVVCMAFAIFFTVFCTNANEGTNAVVYQRMSYEQNGNIPTMSGYLFGGWYAQENETEAVTEPVDGTVYYAKFVPEKVLSIKAQVSNTILADSAEQTAAIRFVTTIDSVQYRKIGFLVQKGTGEAKEANVTNTVYESLYQVTDQDGALGSVLEEVTPAIFDAASKYFKTYTIRKVPDSAYNTDITVTPYWITLDGTKVMGTKSIKTVNLGRSWVYVATSANADSGEYGTYTHPFTKLEDALNGIFLESEGKVIAKGDSPITVPETFEWTKHTVNVNGQVKDCNIMITGETTGAGIDFSAAKELNIGDYVTFDAMTLKFYGQSLDDYGEVYANGNHFTINAGVTSDNKFTTIFGGSKNADVTGDTKIELLAGKYKAVCGGGYSGGVKGSTYVTIKDAEVYTVNTSNQNRIIGGSLNGGTITGDTHVTIGGNFNSGLTVTDNEYSGIYGGCYDTLEDGSEQRSMGIVEGDTYITIKDNAKTGYIYGGGRSKSEVEGTCHVTVNGGTMNSVFGGTEAGGNNFDTSVIINGGEINQIFGGSRHNMTGNTYVEINGGKIHRRIYGGCYSDVTKTEDYHVEGYATVVVKDKDALVLNQASKPDHSLSAGSRCKTGSDKEVGVLIFTDNIYENVANKVGFTADMTSYINAKPYNYLIDVTAGGTVEAGTKMLHLTPRSTQTKGTVAFKDDENVQVYFNAECCWPMVNVGATTQKNVKVDFAASPIEDTSTFEASMDEIYYAQLEDAVDAANVRTNMPTVMVLNDANVERVMYAEKGADFTVQSANSMAGITGVKGLNLFHVLANGKLTIKNLKLANGHNAIASAGEVNVSNVNISDAGNTGLTVSGSAEVSGLTIENAAANGVFIAGGATANIQQLTVNGTGKAAIRPSSTAKISVNEGTITTTTTGGYGIYLDGTCEADITNVAFTTDDAEAICTMGSSKLTLNGVTVERTKSNAKALVSIRGTSTVTMTGTSKIDGKKASFTGRGVEVEGTFILEGGTITSHKVVNDTITNGATALVTAEKVASGTGLADGSGVYVVNGGSFAMNGGYMEENDTDGNMCGAAVSVNGTGATFTLQGGEIRQNAASYGAVMVRTGAFDMYGGKITGNTARNSGGGVVVTQGIFTMHGGEISGNTATANYGGGIYINNAGSIILDQGIICRNTAKKYGGGVYVDHASADFCLSGAIIDENSATSGGGGVAIAKCKSAVMKGGSIKNNKGYTTTTIPSSGSLGGGIYLAASGQTFEMSGGEIIDNTARNGAAICVQSGATAATVKYSGGIIKGNKAVAAGNGNGIKSTSATNPGTIIYLNNTSAADIADGVMTMTVGSEN